MTGGRLLARNTMLNVLGQVVPMLAAVVCIPILIAHLGTARFGVLTLVWAAVGYFGLFDLGLGRALTQAVAQRLGSADAVRDLGEVVWTALGLMFALGTAGALLLAVAAPWIVSSGLNVPAELRAECLASLYLLLLTLPFVASTAGLRGVLEAHQHFGLATALRIPLALFTFVAPLAVLPFSSSLVPVVALLCAGRVLAWLAHVGACVREYAYLRGGVRLRARVVWPLVRAGGWMTVSNIVSPLMAYLDRFLIGALLPLAAVAYYVTPYELVTKLMVLPSAMIAVLFPAFAASFVQDRARTGALFDRAVRVIMLQMFPLVLVFALFAHEGLSAWVGADFARASTPVLQWLAAGIFLNAVAQAPFAVLQGVGRPDLTAKLHLAELPLYLVALWLLARSHGIAGVAAAWTLRVGLDAAALFLVARRIVPWPARELRATLVAIAGALALLLAASLLHGLAAKLSFALAVAVLYAAVGWRHLVHPAERDQLRGLGRLALARDRGGP